MIVTIHALGSIATAAALSRTPDRSSIGPLRLAAGFLAGIVIHGALDLLPHNYPLSPPIDVFVALGLIGLTGILVQKRNRLLVVICFFGALFPDIFDHGPLIAARRFGIAVPHLPFKIFPWHWKEYSGSIYDGRNWVTSLLGHVVIAGFSLAAIAYRRKTFFRSGKDG